MAKRKVTICTGTACYVLGGGDLLLLPDKLPPELKQRVEITGTPCIGLCQQHTGKKPPFVKIDDTVIDEANIQKVIEILLRD